MLATLVAILFHVLCVCFYMWPCFGFHVFVAPPLTLFGQVPDIIDTVQCKNPFIVTEKYV